ncbi:MAG: hypothetical protein IJB67_06140 [Firmicutes bacterium]|nr:hypothetical protein [Bacillota bacterium]
MAKTQKSSLYLAGAGCSAGLLIAVEAFVMPQSPLLFIKKVSVKILSQYWEKIKLIKKLGICLLHIALPLRPPQIPPASFGGIFAPAALILLFSI